MVEGAAAATCGSSRDPSPALPASIHHGDGRRWLQPRTCARRRMEAMARKLHGGFAGRRRRAGVRGRCTAWERAKPARTRRRGRRVDEQVLCAGKSNRPTVKAEISDTRARVKLQSQMHSWLHARVRAATGKGRGREGAVQVEGQWWWCMAGGLDPAELSVTIPAVNGTITPSTRSRSPPCCKSCTRTNFSPGRNRREQALFSFSAIQGLSGSCGKYRGTGYSTTTSPSHATVPSQGRGLSSTIDNVNNR